MKPQQDDINWANVLHTSQPSQPFTNPQEQYWQQQLADINQKIFNLGEVTLNANQYGRLWNTYQEQKQEICLELEKLQ